MSVLDERAADLIRTAWVALETALEPVPARDYPALADPTLRTRLEALAELAGRVLVEHPGGWLTGYPDDICDQLAADGIGVLPPADRAVLALVLMQTICLQRAQGRTDPGWDATGVRTDDLLSYRPQHKTAMRTSLARLAAAGIINRSPAGGISPGPALRRLTTAQSQRLWEDLVLAADPASPIATAIRHRRGATT